MTPSYRAARSVVGILLLLLGALSPACAGRELTDTALEIDLLGGDLAVESVRLELRLPSDEVSVRTVQIGGAAVDGTVVAILPADVAGEIQLSATALDTAGAPLASGGSRPRITPFTLNHTSVTLIALDGGPPDGGPGSDAPDGVADAPDRDAQDADGSDLPVDVMPDLPADLVSDLPVDADADLPVDVLPDLPPDIGPDGPGPACPAQLVRFERAGSPFCCQGTVGAGGSCSGGVCALDLANTDGEPICYELDSALCIAEGFNDYYGGHVGGFCCQGNLGADRDLCFGTDVCALDYRRTQGFYVCPSVAASVCPTSSTFYGDLQGGFCCGPGGTVTNGTCSGGTVCALDPARTQGFPVCYREDSPVCAAEGYDHFYRGLAGGFCCDAPLGPGHDTCTGNSCALDPLRAQGNDYCPSVAASVCPTDWTLYGESDGGFCCGPGGTITQETCTGADVCAVNPAMAQGYPTCPD